MKRSGPGALTRSSPGRAGSPSRVCVLRVSASSVTTASWWGRRAETGRGGGPEPGGEKPGRKGGEEEEGREGHACCYVCPFGPSSQKGGRGLSVLLHPSTSGPGSPAHAHKHMVSLLLPLATYLERKTGLMRAQHRKNEQTTFVRLQMDHLYENRCFPNLKM